MLFLRFLTIPIPRQPPRHHSHVAGFSFVEIVVGAALLLIAGFMIAKNSSDSLKFHQSFDRNIVMRRILDATIAHISAEGSLFLPLNDPGQTTDSYSFKISSTKISLYYSCHSETGARLENLGGDIHFGITHAAYPGPDKTKKQLSQGQLPSGTDLAQNHVGFQKSGKTYTNQVCTDKDAAYILFALPLAKTFDVPIWVYSLKKHPSDKRMKTLTDVAVLSPG